MSNGEKEYQAWLIEEAADHTGIIGESECNNPVAAKLIEYKLYEILDMGVDTSYSDHAAADILLRQYFSENVG